MTHKQTNEYDELVRGLMDDMLGCIACASWNGLNASGIAEAVTRVHEQIMSNPEMRDLSPLPCDQIH